MLRVVREKARVKDFPGDGVHSEVDLVEYGDRTSGSQAQQRVETRKLAAGEPRGLLFHVDAERLDQLVRVVAVPVGARRLPELEGAPGLLVFKYGGRIADVADVCHEAGVFVDGLPVCADASGRRIEEAGHEHGEG